MAKGQTSGARGDDRRLGVKVPGAVCFLVYARGMNFDFVLTPMRGLYSDKLVGLREFFSYQAGEF